jgi:hypothetical protein
MIPESLPVALNQRSSRKASSRLQWRGGGSARLPETQPMCEISPWFSATKERSDDKPNATPAHADR